MQTLGSASTIFEVFDVADALVLSLLEGFSNMHIAYGSINIITTGYLKDTISVYIDNKKVGEDTFFIEDVFIGMHNIKVVQGKEYKPFVLYSRNLRVDEGEEIEIFIDIPLPATYSLGDRGPAGGWIFYDKGSYSNGWRYLEAAPGDQSEGIQWYNGSNTTTGATATEIGAGSANTITIVESQGDGNYAAKLYNDLTIGGYSDWFLPSKDELNQMYVNLRLQKFGGLFGYFYWSSSEYIILYAWGQHFDKNISNYYNKNYTYQVRAVRAF